MSSEIKDAAKNTSKALVEIVCSSHFNRDEILAEKLTLSQAYCLLWHDAKSGDVCGRQCCEEANAGAAAAVLVDLIVLGKVEVEVKPNDNITVKVIDKAPTGKYLDVAILESILQKHYQNPDKSDKVKDWIVNDLHMEPKHQCTNATLDSLVELGILDIKKKRCGNNYPTLKSGPEEELVRQIRSVILDHQEPNSYIRALLTLTRTADKLACLGNPILEKHFSREEYGEAKTRIDELNWLSILGK